MKILLHICCSNCALYPVKILKSEGNKLAGFWFNPNIHPAKEYSQRLESLKKLESLWKFEMIYNAGFEPAEYFELFDTDYSELINRTEVDNTEIPPSTERCRLCYHLRLDKTAAMAKEQGLDAFSTTLLISPYQDFEGIVSTGNSIAEKYNIEFYLQDFRPHFRDAMNLSRELGLYRQKYCGCIFSLEEKNQKRFKGSRRQGIK